MTTNKNMKMTNNDGGFAERQQKEYFAKIDKKYQEEKSHQDLALAIDKEVARIISKGKE